MVSCDSFAVKNFLRLTEFLYRLPYGIYRGRGYKKIFGSNFETATQNFMSSLIAYQYKRGGWEHFFRMNSLRRSLICFAYKLFNKLFRVLHIDLRLSSSSEAYLVNMNRESFLECAREYMDNLFVPLLEKNRKTHVILDQAVAPLNYKEEMNFIRNSKLIIVDRDPRDNYADLIRIGAWGLSQSHDVRLYLAMHSSMRRNYSELKNDPNVLFLRFEDLIFHYDESLKRIAEFAGLNLNDHVHKREFFNPDVSIKNVGMWKEIISQQEADTIASELPEFLYDIPNA